MKVNCASCGKEKDQNHTIPCGRPGVDELRVCLRCRSHYVPRTADPMAKAKADLKDPKVPDKIKRRLRKQLEMF